MHDPREVRKQRAFAPVLMLFGLLFLAAGALAGREMLSLEHGGASASGTVIKLVARNAPKGGRTWHAVVRFSAPDAGPIQFEDRLGTRPPLNKVGDAVRVLYRADSPARSAMVDRGFWNLLPALAFGGVGLLVLAPGVSMRMQAVPAGAAAAPVASTPQAPPREARHARLWTLAL